jgi:hypothetical protein
MKIITLISLCDCIANATVLNGVPSNNDLCILQAIAQQFFFAASWIWTAILTYLLYSLVVHGKISLLQWHMHAITWGICLLITVLPLTTSTYGSQPDDDGWCWIQPSSRPNTGGFHSVHIWDIIVSDVIIFSTFFLMILWGSIIFYKIQFQHMSTTKTVQTALRTLFQYPIILFITWFPYTIFLVADTSADRSSLAWVIIYSLSSWQGGLTSFVFFANSQESRSLWNNLFTQCCVCFGYCCRKPEDDTRNLITVTSAAEFFEDSSPSPANTNNKMNHEDFESDDVYYGREPPMISEPSMFLSKPTIALTEFPKSIITW